jgi:hypothetical protein
VRALPAYPPQSALGEPTLGHQAGRPCVRWAISFRARKDNVGRPGSLITVLLRCYSGFRLPGFFLIRPSCPPHQFTERLLDVTQRTHISGAISLTVYILNFHPLTVPNNKPTLAVMTIATTSPECNAGNGSKNPGTACHGR